MASIYKITNNINGKIYVGQTKNSINKRLEGHFADSKTKKETYFLKAIRKYGRENFSIEEIESTDIDLLGEREIFWISKLDARNKAIGYNTAPGGIGVTEHTDETKEIISQKAKKRFSNKENHPWFGKKLSKEHKEKISKNHADVSGENNPFYGKCWSESERKRIGDFHRGKTIPIEQREKSSKLDSKSVVEIKKMLKEQHLKQCEIAKIFNVSTATISMIKNKKLWKDIKIP